ncbi:MAG: PEP/pyruvate-binding domain-containing protein [Methanolinea sp.]|nr:PEP/pyruvate-binding domain-containing protein [Methanolinea sp.]
MAGECPRMVVFGPGITAHVPAAEFGNKASIVAAMANIGIPVPPGFSLHVSVCEEYFREDRRLPADVPDLLRTGMQWIEKSMGLAFGSSRRPLLVSVRSGAPVTMPGVMDTVLNVGLTRETVRGLVLQSGNPRFAWDSYRRFIEQFATTVCGHDHRTYREIVREYMDREGVADEAALDFASLQEIASQFERVFQRKEGRRFPDDVYEQLARATEAVLASWMNPRAEQYRRIHRITDARGTAVTVQAMVFGNLGAASGAGVAFSRNPWTGEPGLLVDFKFGAQGEDVVSGEGSGVTQEEFRRRLPAEHAALQGIASLLEREFRDMQDIEFTIQEGSLYILQSRAGKRAPYAALRIAVDMEREGIVTREEALRMLEGIDVEGIVLRRVRATEPPVAVGVSASLGVACGMIALSADRAVQFSQEGKDAILVRETATPDDIQGIDASLGILTARGARTSHAAVVARQLGKVCIVACRDLRIDMARRACRFRDTVLYEGDRITLDGETGAVYAGAVAVVHERPEDLIRTVRSWRAGRGN